jgi:hypothetical protein
MTMTMSEADTRSLQGEHSETASPDELLLELMDLVALAMPQSLSSMKVSFVANADGKRPALANLDGKAAPGAPLRVDLGHDDGHVLDAINALLAELSTAIESRGGRSLRIGHIDIDSDASDHSKTVIIVDDGIEPPLAHVSRRFDRSELRWLLFTPALFSALQRTQAQTAPMQARLQQALAGTERFAIDMDRAIITFSGPGPDSPWRFELLGSYLNDDARFLWGFANDAIKPSLAAAVTSLRARNLDEGLRLFTDASWGGPEAMAATIAAHAAVEAGAFAMYRAPFKGRDQAGLMYLALFAL